MEAAEQTTYQPATLGHGAALKRAVTEAHVVLNLLIAQHIKALGLTIGEADVLTIIMVNVEPIRPSQIAAQLNITSAGATGRLKGLERRGLITRVKNPDDGRSVTIHLTDSGTIMAATVIELKDSAIEGDVVGKLGKATCNDLTIGLDRLVAVVAEGLDP